MPLAQSHRWRASFTLRRDAPPAHFAEAGEGEPVLLLHGWPQHWYAWRKVIPLLGESHRLISPDLRGFGWTDAPRMATAPPSSRTTCSRCSTRSSSTGY